MKKFLDKIHCPNWLVLILAVVILLRIPSFFEPYYYGDEAIYLNLGEGIKKGLTLYSQIHDNKPPAIYLLGALAGNLFWFKAILAFWSLATIIFFWHLAKALFPNKERLHKIAVVVFALLTTLPLLEGNIANSELFMIGPTIVGFLILLTQKLNFKNIFLAGVFFSLAALFKIPAAFDIPAIVVYWLIQTDFKKEDLKVIAKRTFFLILGFSLPILLTFIYFAFKGALKDYFVAAFLQNIGYLSSWRGEIQKPFLVRNLPLLIRSLIVLSGLGVLFAFKKKLSRQFLFLSAWTLFGLFAITLSERPYPHYLIQVVPEVSFFFALLLAERSLEQSLSILPLVLVFFVPFYYKYWHYSTLTYYQRFASFMAGKINKEEYFFGFGKRVNANYELTNVLVTSTSPKDSVYVWGEESPVVYALAKHLPPYKYVATYHVLDYSTREAEAKILVEKKPSLIVLLPESPTFPQIIPLLRKDYFLLLTLKGAEVWRLKTF
jgi:4-amino-4-deoxy-L-arabinose transferase-like glycosyltransferase